MKKVQLYIDEHKDKTLFELIEKLEEEGQGTRGYITDRLKDRLKTFELLAQRFKESDPTALAIKLSSGNLPSSSESTRNNEEKEKSSRYEEDILDIGNSASFFKDE